MKVCCGNVELTSFRPAAKQAFGLWGLLGQTSWNSVKKKSPQLACLHVSHRVSICCYVMLCLLISGHWPPDTLRVPNPFYEWFCTLSAQHWRKEHQMMTTAEQLSDSRDSIATLAYLKGGIMRIARCHHTQLGIEPHDSRGFWCSSAVLYHVLSEIYCHCGWCNGSHFRLDEVRALAKIWIKIWLVLIGTACSEIWEAALPSQAMQKSMKANSVSFHRPLTRATNMMRPHCRTVWK